MEEENMYSNITQVRRGAGELCAEDEPGMERLLLAQDFPSNCDFSVKRKSMNLHKHDTRVL